MKKFLIIFNLVLFSFLGTVSISNASNQVNAYLFYGQGCPHCVKEQVYFKTIEDKYPSLELKVFEVYHNESNILLLQEVAKILKADTGSVPFLVIGDEYFVGYSDSISPKQIEKRINECLDNICPDSIAKFLGTETQEENLTKKTETIKSTINTTEEKPDVVSPEEQNQLKKDGNRIHVPVLGEIGIKDFSLPILTVILAFLDGFNPCAMWVLLFLVSLLFGIENKKRLWTFGLVFLFSSAVVYFLFMAAWLNLFMFLGFIALVRIIIGIIALVSAYFNIKEYITNPSGGCKVTGGKKRQKVFEKLKKIIQQKHFAIAILGLVLLAFAVNLIELVCSLGLPAVYVQILSLSDLSTWQYYLYLIFYVLVFIIPAFAVFSISAITLQLTGIFTKYGRIVHLVSGIIMLILGLLMIFKPEWLMFG